ncbi:molybdopterin-guanine dinucleotide biosynthesis protein MobA, partial [Salmonella enterica subsp. enterica serovar Abony]|nr:molybdopterin-guanine dinucleotide biosynthesis protein MobA [Salmonella enterica subsp. enterica serovar Abony]HBD1791447.1 molybdopterin-guanine dinucleotide biosynthesis protein MobA [Salmonella enterica]
VVPASHTHIRGVKSYRNKSKVSKVVAGKKPSVRFSDSGTNTILKTSSSQNPNRASRSAPECVKGKQAIPRQDNIFKRFSALLVNFIRNKFIWAKTNKTKVDSISEEHDKRIAENYVFDEVLGHPVLRAEYEKRAKFNQDDYKPTPDEISRFPSRPKNELPEHDNGMDLTPAAPQKNSKYGASRLRPPGRSNNV